MSLIEIEALIVEKSLVPDLLAASMMKQITWDDQWIGYDDNETIAMKKTWANGLCFGGTMVSQFLIPKTSQKKNLLTF